MRRHNPNKLDNAVIGVKERLYDKIHLKVKTLDAVIAFLTAALVLAVLAAMVLR